MRNESVTLTSRQHEASEPDEQKSTKGDAIFADSMAEQSMAAKQAETQENKDKLPSLIYCIKNALI